MRRAQSAVEFIMITVVMSMFFTVAFITAQQNYADIQDAQFQQSIYEFLERIQSEFVVAYQTGEGYERDIYVPETLSGVLYDIDLYVNQTPESTSELAVTVYGQEYFLFLPIAVNGSIQKGMHTIYGGSPVEITTMS